MLQHQTKLPLYFFAFFLFATMSGSSTSGAAAFSAKPLAGIHNHRTPLIQVSPPTHQRGGGTSLHSSSTQPQKTVGWTIANLFRINDTLLVVYHAAGTAWDNLVPFGALLGAVAYKAGFNPLSSSTVQSAAGDSAYWTGLIVMALGIAKLYLWDVQQPWFVDMTSRAQVLKEDYSKRVMDQSAWIGCGLAILPILLAEGGAAGLGLAPGGQGVIQGLCLGTVAGSLVGWYRQIR